MRVVNYLSRAAALYLVAWSLASIMPDLLGAQPAFANETALPGLSLGGGQSATSSSPIMSTSARMIGGLFLCLGVFAIIVRLLKRHASRSGTGRRRLEIRERVALSSKASLTLVAIDNREFLVASGSESVSILPTRVVPPGLFDESLDEVADEAEAFNA
jgi:flagellar biogenesis protein FliO